MEFPSCVQSGTARLGGTAYTRRMVLFRSSRLIGVGVLAVVLSGAAVAAEDLNRYREFELGSSVATVSTLTGVAGSELKAVHQRPAVIQELTWRPRYGARRNTESADQLVFDFYDDQLFRVTVDYDRRQTEGLIDADMIEAIASVYGPPLAPVASRRRQPTTVGDDGAVTIAEWSTAANSVKLHRLPSSLTSFRLVITAEPISVLARTAAARAVVLDAREAPQREAARDKKEADERRVADEKARSTNKATFKP
jgi:hypothetical protein